MSHFAATNAPGRAIRPTERHRDRLGGPASQPPLLRLQQSRGNQAVLRMLSHPGAGVIQRCSGEVECGPCEEERLDLQRRATGAAAPEGVPISVVATLRDPGQPLDQATRALFEPRFQHDFGEVRFHTGALASASARAVAARAYTVGRHIVFGAGAYAPGDYEGRCLLAHELAHVVQQRATAGASPSQVGRSDDTAEREAEAAAGSVMDAGRLVVTADQLGAASGGRLARQGEQRMGPSVGGFFHDVGRAIVDLFTGTEPEYDDATLQNYLRMLDQTNDIENDFDSDNKARAVVQRRLLDGIDLRIRILLIREMLSGFTGDNDEKAILVILQAASPEGRASIAERIGLEDLYDNIHGDELDRLYLLYPVLDSLHPRKEETTAYTVEEYIEKWQQEKGRSMTPAEKQVLARGCIGITALELGTLGRPDLSNCYETFREALSAQTNMNAFLSEHRPDRKALIFSKRFWSGGRTHPRDPATGKVDLRTYNYSARPGFTNFDYGLYDEETGRWWHANHCDTTLLSRPSCGGSMEVYESSLEYYSRGLLDFDSQVFCVGVGVVPP